MLLLIAPTPERSREHPADEKRLLPDTMDMHSQQTSAPAPESGKSGDGQTLSRSQSRRRKIFRSLHDCIIETGYSKTTLADIAGRAGMTPSHLLYYFQGKERILEEYFADVAEWFLRRVDAISREPADRRLALLTRLWFGDSERAYADIGFMLECFGEAVHDGAMRETKASFDRACKDYLEQMLFDEESGSNGAPEAAELSYALLIGLRNSVYFDKTLSLASASALFCSAINDLRRHGENAAPEEPAEGDST